MCFKTLLFLFFAVWCSEVILYRPTPTPVVLWHGQDDYSTNKRGAGAWKKAILKFIPGIYVLSLQIGNNKFEDKFNSFFKDANAQVRIACDQIRSTPELAEGYNAIGFSQGSQLLRAVAQRCPEPRMFNLISLGGQHQGVYGLPEECSWCAAFKRLVRHNKFIYNSYFQNRVLMAQMWHDPTLEESYRKKSGFIGEINNEHKINDTYKYNLMRLENFVLVKFENDMTVIPNDSSWFEFYSPDQAEKIEPLEHSRIYEEDRLGLNRLHKTGRLHFILKKDSSHLQMNYRWFYENILIMYLV